MRIEAYGQSAILVSFEKKIDLKVHNKVLQLYERCKAAPEFTFFIPAYHTLTLGIDLNQITLSDALQKMQEWVNQKDLSTPLEQFRKVTIPICYSPTYATDLNAVEQITQMSFNRIIEEHLAHSYRVFMLGFVAGFAYMGKLPDCLNVSRKSTPEKQVPAGAVGIAGLQTGIYPVNAPGGWQIIGRTPVRIFDASRDTPNLLTTGDEVSFRAISEDEFRLIEIKQETGIYEPEFQHNA